ncbi:MAG: hypothetical protein HOJ21_03910 [Alphaproteobacteria bacterium]|jgi:uncharacterized membrane protein|nr:hypothetical protein [Alphaproteobacteria bacterium]
MIHAIALSAHLLAAIIWVGGMFFAYMALRPSMPVLSPPDPVKLWGRVFFNFFNWVWLSIIVLVLTGYWMLFAVYGGFALAPAYLHIMHGLGLVMIALYLHLFFAPYGRLQKALAADDFPAAAAQIPKIRRIVAINLVIGLANAAIGSGGRYWPW